MYQMCREKSKSLVKIIEKHKKMLDKLISADCFFLKDLNIDFWKNNKKHRVEGVYILLDEKNKIIYSGKTSTKTILDRVGNQHIYGGSSSDLRDMLGRPSMMAVTKYKCKYLEVKNYRNRSMFEHFVISIMQPPLNK